VDKVRDEPPKADTIGGATLYRGDCLEVMPKLLPGSVDLILCDPPYGMIKGLKIDGWSEGDTRWDDVLDMGEFWKAADHALRMNGCAIMFGQEPFTSRMIVGAHPPIPFSYKGAWLKNHFANPLAARKAPVSYFEDICFFFKRHDTTKSHPLRAYAGRVMDFIGKGQKRINADLGHRRAEHFFEIENIQFALCTEPTYQELIDFYGIDKMEGFEGYGVLREIDRTFRRTFNLPPGKNHKSNVFKYKKDHVSHHPTQKSVALLEDLIRTYTNEGDTVLDPTMGSGSTAIACLNTGRKFIGIEMDESYYDVAVARIGKAAGSEA